MHLKRISQLGLLDFDCDEPNILEAFPGSISRGLVRDISEMILGTRRGQNKLTTSPQINWVLQVLAHGFALPLSDANLIESCVMIYSQWLLEHHTRPVYLSKVSSEEEQFFIRRLLLHLSQVFTFQLPNRAPNISEKFPEESPETSLTPQPIISAGIVQRYVDLTKHVTALYASVGRALGTNMEEKTWKVLLSCLLAAIDNMIGFEGLSTNKELVSPALILAVEVLCDPLMRTLMELWLRSKTKDASLWNSLTSCFKIWSSRSVVIQHWNAVTLGLTQRLMDGLYNPITPIEFRVNNLNYNLILYLDQESSVWLWYKFLFLLKPDPERDSANLSLILQGISQIVGVLSKNVSGSAPSGNTLLRIVGPWLFETCLASNSVSSESVENDSIVVALSTLCKIFSQKPFYTFASHYREIFIGCLHQGFSQESSLQAILLHGGELLGQSKIGLELLPFYLGAFPMVIPTLTPGFRLIAPLDQTRRGILLAIMHGYVLPRRFPTALTPPDWPPAGVELHLPPDLEYSTNVTSFKDLSPYIIQVLFQFLSSETDPTNFRMTIDLLLLHIAEESQNNKQPLAIAILRATVSQILRSGVGADLTLICIETIDRLIITGSVTCLDEMSELINTISNYIIFLLDNEDFTFSEPILISSYKLLARWVAIFDSKEFTNTFPIAFCAICRGLTINEETIALRKLNSSSTQQQRGTLRHQIRSVHNSTNQADSDSPESRFGRVSLAARLALNTVLYSKRIPLSFDDLSVAKMQCGLNGDKAVQYFFISPDTLISIIEEPNSQQATVVMRDSFGKIIWDISTVNDLKWSKSSDGYLVPLASPIPPNPTPLYGPSLVDTDILISPESKLMSNPVYDLSNSMHPLDPKIVSLTESQKSNEERALKRPNRVAKVPAIPPPSPLPHHLIARQFLLQLGIIGPHASGAVPIPLTHRLINNIVALDSLPTLSKIPVTLLYSPHLGPPTLSPLSLPASFIELASHLNKSWKSTKSDPFVQISLDCPYALIKDDYEEYSKHDSSFINDFNIVIVYCDVTNYFSRAQSPNFPSSLWSQVGGSFLITIAPESENYFRIRLAGPDKHLSRSFTPWIGPLSDDILVNKVNLNHLVRATVISIWSSLSLTDSVLEPYFTRSACLNKISNLGQSLAGQKMVPQRYFSVLLRPTLNPTWPWSPFEASSEQLNDPIGSKLSSSEPILKVSQRG